MDKFKESKREEAGIKVKLHQLSELMSKFKGTFEKNDMLVSTHIKTIGKKVDENRKTSDQLYHVNKDRMETKFVEIEQRLEGFVNKIEMEKLKKFAAKFANKDMIDSFKNEMMPKMINCEEILEMYEKDNTQMKDCVLSMDRELCNKVSKFNYLELKNRVQRVSDINEA